MGPSLWLVGLAILVPVVLGSVIVFLALRLAVSELRRAASAARPGDTVVAEKGLRAHFPTLLGPTLLLSVAGVLVLWLGVNLILVSGVAGVLLFGAGAGFLVLAFRARRRKGQEFRARVLQQADTLGFRDIADPGGFLGSLGLLKARAFRSRRIIWGLEGSARPARTILASVRSRWDDQQNSYLVACFETAGPGLPDFDLWVKTFGDERLFGHDLAFDTHPGFSGRYRLTCSDEQAVRGVFRPEVLDFFMRNHCSAEARGGWLILHSMLASSQDLTLRGLPEFRGRSQELFDLVTARR